MYDYSLFLGPHRLFHFKKWKLAAWDPTKVKITFSIFQNNLFANIMTLMSRYHKYHTILLSERNPIQPYIFLVIFKKKLSTTDFNLIVSLKLLLADT